MGNVTTQGLRYPYSEDPLSDLDIANLAADLDTAMQTREVTRDTIRRRPYGEVQRFFTALTVARATHVTLTFDTVVEDVEGLWNTGTGRMTPPNQHLGLWFICLAIGGLALPSDATFIEGTIRKNGTLTRYRHKIRYWNSNLAVFGEVELTAPGDFVDFDTFWSGGVAASTSYGSIRAMAFKISDV